MWPFCSLLKALNSRLSLLENAQPPWIAKQGPPRPGSWGSSPPIPPLLFLIFNASHPQLICIPHCSQRAIFHLFAFAYPMDYCTYPHSPYSQPNSYSSCKTQIRCHFLQESSLKPHTGKGTLLCTPQDSLLEHIKTLLRLFKIICSRLKYKHIKGWKSDLFTFVSGSINGCSSQPRNL